MHSPKAINTNLKSRKTLEACIQWSIYSHHESFPNGPSACQVKKSTSENQRESQSELISPEALAQRQRIQAQNCSKCPYVLQNTKDNILPGM